MLVKTKPRGSRLLPPAVRKQKRKQWAAKRNLAIPYISLRNAACRIRRRGDECFITGEQLIKMWEDQKGLCAMSGIRMTWGEGKITLTSVSVDRTIPTLGYRLGNVRLICSGMNMLKSNATDAEALALARAFVEYSKSAILDTDPSAVLDSARADPSRLIPIGSPRCL